MTCSWLLVLVAPSIARAGTLGVGAGVGLDLPDSGNPEVATRFTSANLLLPLRLDVAPAARIRLTFHAEFGLGHDFVTWVLPSSGREGQETKAWFGNLALTLGPEVRIPLSGPVEPYLAGGAGVALVHTWHNLELVDLFDEHYTEDDLDNPLTIDPFSRQPVFTTDVALGATVERFWFEAGYSVQFIDTAPLVHSPLQVDARRERYWWNAIRLVAGYSFPVLHSADDAGAAGD